MNTIATIGAQWGDEGKGKVIDILASKADYVVRATGGSNAGHTVVSGGKTYKLHLIPSGILYPDTINIVGNGVVVDPGVVLEEMQALEAQGVSMKNLYIDLRAHVVMPYHRTLDELAERAKGDAAIGTTKRGIGPCYADKCDRIGIRMIDLIDPDKLAKKLEANLEFKNKIITNVYGEKPLDYAEIYEAYTEYAKKLEKHICDTGVMLYDAIKADKRVIFEGAQVRNELAPDKRRVLRRRGRRTDSDKGSLGHSQIVHHARRRGSVPHRAQRRGGQAPARSRARVRHDHGQSAALRLARHCHSPHSGAAQRTDLARHKQARHAHGAT